MNDGVACFAFFLFAMLVVAVVVAIHVVNAQRTGDAYRRLARRFGGSCQGTGFFETPRVHFQYHNVAAAVDVQRTSGNQASLYTRLQIGWPDRHFRLEVYPENLLHRLQKFIGMRDYEIGSLEFDADFIINGNDEQLIKGFLNAEVQQRVDWLRRFSQLNSIHLSVSGGRLSIKTGGFIRDYDTLSRFVAVSLEVYDHAVHSNTEGIDFVEAVAASSATMGDPVCQICGEEIKLEAVACRTCKTPHHKDCWQYYGACSTFGCGQTRYFTS